MSFVEEMNGAEVLGKEYLSFAEHSNRRVDKRCARRLASQTDDLHTHRFQSLPNLIEAPTPFFDVLSRYPRLSRSHDHRQPIVKGRRYFFASARQTN